MKHLADLLETGGISARDGKPHQKLGDTRNNKYLNKRTIGKHRLPTEPGWQRLASD